MTHATRAATIRACGLSTARTMLGTGQPLNVYAVMWAATWAEFDLAGAR